MTTERIFFKTTILAIQFLLVLIVSPAQELYVFSEPASNMPSRSISGKYAARFLKGYHSRRLEQRHTPELMFGISKKWMLHLAPTFSDMHSANFRWESARLYGKYRFFSKDDVHKHFRMAAFGEISYARNDLLYDELSLEGDNSGILGGIIATQLLNKTAVSSTVGVLTSLTNGPENYNYSAINYSLSAGYLLLPRSYTDYSQMNLNIYAELLGQQRLNGKPFFIDIAPAIQFIFNSNSKLNIGYRFQLNGNMHRMSENSWLVSFERTFLNVLSH